MQANSSTLAQYRCTDINEAADAKRDIVGKGFVNQCRNFYFIGGIKKNHWKVEIQREM